MKFNFFDVFKYVLFRKASNAIINKTIAAASQNIRSGADLSEMGYKIPNWKSIAFALFLGWFYSVAYVAISFIFIAMQWYIVEWIFTGLYFGLLILLYFENRVIYKKKKIPVYTKDLRYKSGQRHTGNKIANDPETAMPMPKNGRIIQAISTSIIIVYFLCLGLPASYGIYSYYKKDRELKKIEKTGTPPITDSIPKNG
ncbi:MAG: hypothetical protein Q8928_02555 [Bacteroidota bacterium]|nr:hypothetical protein [Bacteroidota bacterium]